MSPERARLSAILAAGLALLWGLGLGGCERTPRSAVTATQPRPVDSGEMTEGEPAEEPFARDVDAERADVEAPPSEETPRRDKRDDAADSAPVTIEMDEPREPEPKLPRYLSIVERINAARQARVHATPIAPRKLVVTTQNIKRIRLTREGLPLLRNRSIVLQIDGQGIEWTPKYVAVELERSPAGAWTVVRRRPVKP